MKSFKGNMINLIGKVDALCITTNGFVKKNGECVMGRGIAKAIKDILPTVSKIVGDKIKENGNVVNYIMTLSRDNKETNLCAFPVKPVSIVMNKKSDVVRHMATKFNIGDTVPGWACKADINIIENSALELERLATKHKWETIAIPRAGCGAGELDWNDVKPILSTILDDRFIECTFK